MFILSSSGGKNGLPYIVCGGKDMHHLSVVFAHRKNTYESRTVLWNNFDVFISIMWSFCNAYTQTIIIMPVKLAS